MESLDLNGLAKSLPAANFEKAEKELLNNFKSAALSITTLYRSSRHASKRAYNAGYAAACQDLMTMFQQGVSTGGVALSGSNNPPGDVMTIGRIMDWIEARMEAVKAREEEEDEDEEREKEKERARGSVPASRNDTNKDSPARDIFPGEAARNSAQTVASSSRTNNQTATPAPLTPHSPFTVSNTNVPNRPPSPTPSVIPPPPPRLSNHPHIIQRASKSRAPGAKKDNPEPFPVAPITACLTPSENLFRTPPVTTATSVTGEPAFSDYTAGAKRRHAVMMMLDSTTSGATESSSQGSSVMSTTTSASGNTRRRTRSSRTTILGTNHPQIQNNLGDAMDIEDEGRERKRVARR